MKSVLISINPKWCELIAFGMKTVEVRKTRPKIETPFKCYIYETKIAYNSVSRKNDGLRPHLVPGKVIGEFVCDKVGECIYDAKYDYYETDWDGKADCLSHEELSDYMNGKNGFGWHISDLVIYDEPKELGDFVHCKKFCEDCPPLYFHSGCIKAGVKSLTRPPESWCYVEELK